MEVDTMQEDRLLNALDAIKPDTDEFINRRINHLNFSRTIFYLCVKARSESFVYARPLADFLKISMQRSLTILNELARAGVLIKKYPTSNLTEFWFVLEEEDTPLVMRYFSKCKKTLGVEFKISLEPKNKKREEKKKRIDLI